MFRREAAPARQSARGNNPQAAGYPRAPGGAHSSNFPDLQRLTPYEWNCPPSTSTVARPQAPSMIAGRKRQHTANSPNAVKRQRINSQPLSPPALKSPTHPPYYSDLLYSEPARSFCFGVYPILQPQAQSVPDSSSRLQTYVKSKLCSQMVELFEACQQKYPDLQQKEMCRADLQKDIQHIYPEARLYLTGSSMNGLGCRSSDADLCLVIRGNKKPDPIAALSLLKRFFSSLSYVERVQLIRAKVPILKFRVKSRKLEFDLNVNNTVGIRNTFLLQSYADADPRVGPVILVLKKWARHHQINDASKGTLSSYTLVLMVLHYLQTLRDPVLPSLQRDYPECFDPCMDIDAVPLKPKHIPPYISRNQSSLGELLLGFLKYYTSEFSWNERVISVREGRAFPKNGSHEWRNKFICVEEPFERKNVARAVYQKAKFDLIKAQFANSSRKLHTKKDLDSIIPVRAVIREESLGR